MDENKYLTIFTKALKEVKCPTDFIRMAYIGSPKAGKTSVLKLFTKQELMDNSPDIISMENCDNIIDLVYNFSNYTVSDFPAILHNKIVAAIESINENKIAGNIKQHNVETDQIPLAVTMETPLLDPTESNHDVYIPTTDTNTIINSMTSDDNNDNDQLQFLSHLSQQYYQRYLTLEDNSILDNFQYGKLWDFSGQAGCDAIHHPFLSDHCVYILVFNIACDIKEEIKDVRGRPTGKTHLESIREWLTSIIGSFKKHDHIEVTTHGIRQKFSLPIIVLVASHADEIVEVEERNIRFENFQQDLIKSSPYSEDHLCSTGIVFNCNPQDDSQATQEYRDQCCQKLHDIINGLITSLPFIHINIPIKWYIMAAILYTSTIIEIDDAQTTSHIDPINSNRVDKIMTFQQVRCLAQDYHLYENDANLKGMLDHLHHLGQVFYFQNVGQDGMVITDVRWLLNIFGAIMNCRYDQISNVQDREFFRNARSIGNMPQSWIDYATQRFNVNQEQKKILLQLMESHYMIYQIKPINNQDQDMRCYLIPSLLDSCHEHISLKKYHVSNCLYLGHKERNMPYIADSIFYSFLISCARAWPNATVKYYHHCARYYFTDSAYEFIVKKKNHYIALYYCYRKNIDRKTANNIQSLLFYDRPHDQFRARLSSIIRDRMPKFRDATCHLYIQCHHCKQLINTQKCNDPNDSNIKCRYCMRSLGKEYLDDWMFFTKKSLRGICQEDQNSNNDCMNYFSIINDNIGKDWSKLGSELLDKTTLDTLNYDLDGIYNEVNAGLHKWYNSQYPNVDISVLKMALLRINKEDIVNKIEQAERCNNTIFHL